MAGRTKTRGASAVAKTPCPRPEVCGTRNHQIGSFSHQRCQRAGELIAAGQNITKDTLFTVTVPRAANSDAAPDRIKDQRDQLIAQAESWRDDPANTLKYIGIATRLGGRFSPTNRLLIAMQKEDATDVRTRSAWAEVGRTVKEDATVITVFAPGHSPTVPKLDADGKPVLDEDGNPVMIKRFVSRFRGVEEFDISDTEGEPLSMAVTDDVDADVLRERIRVVTQRYMETQGIDGADLAPGIPAMIREDGSVVYNTITDDPAQRGVNQMLALGMIMSKRLRSDEAKQWRGKDKTDRWSQEAHTYAGAVAAWQIAQDAGVDITDSTLQVLSRFNPKEKIGEVASHAAKVVANFTVVDEAELPSMFADMLTAHL